MNSKSSRQAAHNDTAYILLEMLPSIMGHVSSDLRRNSNIDNPVHFRLLRTLRRSRRSLHELAGQHGVRLPTMSRTVSVLEKRSWIERIRSEEDRRTVYAVITDTGKEVLEHAEWTAVRRVTELLDSMPENEVESLRSGLSALYKVVSEQIGLEAKENLGNFVVETDCHNGEKE